jgi:UDP-N-acetylmuramyl-tripeptide synthetase
LKVIGVTGTKGKTTTAYLIHAILTKAGYKTGLIGTITHPMTTPEASDLQGELAQMLYRKMTHCVMEVSSHALAQERVLGTNFTVAIFTNLSHDHLDFHKNMENYLSEKIKLFKMLLPDGIAIVNVDDPCGKYVIERVKGEVITYGISQAMHELRSTRQNEFDVKVSDIQIRRDEMTLKINSFEIKTPLLGMPNVYNIAAAFQCGLAIGISQRVIKEGIESVKLVPGRFEKVECGQPFSVVIDFAHSPDSLQKLLETFRPLTQGKIILVFGCPGDRDREKRSIMGKIASNLADYTIISTDDPHSEDPSQILDEIEKGIDRSNAYQRIADRSDAIAEALKMAREGDCVLIAGRGHEKYQDFNGINVPFIDQAVVKEILLRHANN